MKRKLTDEQVVSARQLYASGHSGGSISRSLGVSDFCVMQAIYGITYADIPGCLPKQKESGFPKLTTAQVIEIRQMYRDGHTNTEIAQRFSMSVAAIWGAVTGKTFKDVPGVVASHELRSDRKLTEEQAETAREMYRSGHPQSAIADHFSVSRRTMGDIVAGITYANVPGAVGKEEGIAKRNISRGGVLCSLAKLDDDDVTKIRSLLREGLPAIKIAEMFGVSGSAISAIARGKTWTHIGPRLSLDPNRNMHRSVQIGSKNGSAKLDEITVSYIKCHLNEGVSQGLLAKYFKVSKCTIRQIFHRLNWKQVKPAKKAAPLIFSPETDKPMRLRGKRLDEAFQARRSRVSSDPLCELAQCIEQVA
jgi:predicted DNA-binding protein YlxM (UPF0122 family)